MCHGAGAAVLKWGTICVVFVNHQSRQRITGVTRVERVHRINNQPAELNVLIRGHARRDSDGGGRQSVKRGRGTCEHGHCVVWERCQHLEVQILERYQIN